MATTVDSHASGPGGLRLRNVGQPNNDAVSTDSSASTPKHAAQPPAQDDADAVKKQQQQQQQQKVMGRTPDGKVFAVPHTPDMLTSIFHPRQPKTPLDLLTLASLALQIVLYFSLSRRSAKLFFFVYFALWRSTYNGGLGYLLKQQSERGWIVRQVRKRGWMDEKRRPKVREWIKQQLVTKMDKDYDFEALPLDYNVWLLFRSIVDLILLNDFVAYSLFAFSCTRLPEGHSVLLHVLRWVAGWGLIFFNLWVKMDAHRVVKDYAWYWGDCFFLCLQSLVFDGVYEVAPDPMYSIGYAGYYGLSLVSGSYAVLFVSLAAHGAQMAFLWFFESPHIERTYGEKKPLAARVPLSAAPYNAASASVAAGRSPSYQDDNDDGNANMPSPKSPSLAELDPPATPSQTDGTSASSEDELQLDERRRRERVDQIRKSSEREAAAAAAAATAATAPSRSSYDHARRGVGDRPASLHDIHHRIFRKDTVVFRNLDPLRSTDFLLIVAALYGLAPFVAPRLGHGWTVALLLANALAWRLFHSFGLGALLRAQSESKWMVRHFVKHYHYDHAGDAVYHAFDSFKVIYNTSLVMVYISYGVLCMKCYAPLGRDWTVGTDLLRHVLGLLLIGLHIWAANSSYAVLGPFGWFYGDFFVSDEYPIQLYHSGIFRFLNNPERTMGGAAFFGLALISGSKVALATAIVSVACHWVFLSTVEGPHLRKLYGEAATKREAGITKQLKNVARSSHLTTTTNRYSASLLRAAQQHPRFQEMRAEFERVQKDATLRFEDFVSRSVPKFEGFVEDTRSLLQQGRDRLLIVREGELGKVSTIDRSRYSLQIRPSTSQRNLRFHVGEAIEVQWNAPATHSRRDWIGVYALSRLGQDPRADAAAGGLSSEGGGGGPEGSRLITKISSQGKWLGVAEDEWEGDVHTGGSRRPSARGEMAMSESASSSSSSSSSSTASGTSVFRGAKLPTDVGLYEFRYHYDAKHNVLARSEVFEIYVDKPADPYSFDETYASLSNIVLYALDDASNAPESARKSRRQLVDSNEAADPSTPSAAADDAGHTRASATAAVADPDDFAIYAESEARRIAKAIRVAFGVDFATDVICAEPNLRKLATDIVDAKRLLDPGFHPIFVASAEQ